jgi:FkbM family methyltransferase
MHPITSDNVNELLKYNLKNNFSHLIELLSNEDKKHYYVSWVGGKKVLMRKGKTDVLVFKQIFINGEYNFKFKTDVKTIIDVGANIGLSALYLANRFPQAQIVAVEPEPSNFKLLQKNTEQYPNIFPLLGGISNQSGQFKIQDSAADHWAFRLENCEEGKGDGRMYTMSEVMEQFNMPEVDFLKIDIEGGEASLFQSNYEWLQKVRSLSIELHDFIIPYASNAFFNALCAHQPFLFTTYGENHFIEFDRP